MSININQDGQNNTQHSEIRNFYGPTFIFSEKVVSILERFFGKNKEFSYTWEEPMLRSLRSLDFETAESQLKFIAESQTFYNADEQYRHIILFANSYLGQGNYKEAITQLSRLLDIERKVSADKKSELYAYLALSNILDNKIEKAEERIEQALKHDSQNAKALSYKINLINIEEELDGFITEQTEEIKNNYEFLLILSNKYQCLGSFDKAIEYSRKAVKFKPENANMDSEAALSVSILSKLTADERVLWSGQLTDSQKDLFEESISLLNDALNSIGYPNNPEGDKKLRHRLWWLANRAVAYIYTKQFDKAQIDLEKCYEINPNSPQVIENLARVHFRNWNSGKDKKNTRELEKANELLERISSKEHGFIAQEAASRLATGYYLVRDYPSCLNTIEKALEWVDEKEVIFKSSPQQSNATK